MPDAFFPKFLFFSSPADSKGFSLALKRAPLSVYGDWHLFGECPFF